MTVKLIDLVKARLDAKSNAYLAELPSLGLRDVRIDDSVVRDNERMLTGGFYAEVELDYDSVIADENNGRPFSVGSLRPIQLSTRDSLKRLAEGRPKFTTEQWKQLLLRSVGFEPERLSTRQQDVLLLRMVPFVQRTSTWSSSDREEQASRTCSSRSRRMPTSSQAARRRWPACSSTTPQVSAGS